MNHLATALKIRRGQMLMSDVTREHYREVRKALQDERALRNLAVEQAVAVRGSRFDDQPKPGPLRVRV